ncbi:hypothetical protein LJB88_02080 [Erysipelotrichaceae bacterium OttesenSCG-928-M19]|nr:hypothetical protein [Erysipelotrichaceae bacterium OttesenSCG-928-M19]
MPGNNENQPNDLNEKTFTQEQVNSYVKSAKEEVSTKLLSELGFKDIDDAKDFIAGSSKKDEKLTTVQSELEAFKLKDLKIMKAIEHGLGIDNIDMLSGSDEESIEQQAKRLSTFIEKNNSQSEKVNNSENKTKTKDDFGDALMNAFKEDNNVKK